MFDLNGEVKESSTYVFFKFLTKGHFTAFLAVKWAFLGKPVYRISLNNVRVIRFYGISRWGNYSRVDIIQGRNYRIEKGFDRLHYSWNALF